MSNRTDKDFLLDIQEAIRRIKSYTYEMTYEEFLADTRTQDAVIRNLEVIGEATKKLSAGLRSQYANVPWKEMAGARIDLFTAILVWILKSSGKSLLLNCPILPYKLRKSYAMTPR